MVSTSQKRLTRLRFLCASIAVLIGTASGPVALATKGSDVCGMACCVKEASCCCVVRRPRVERKSGDRRPRVGVSLSAPCAESCTTSARSSKLTRRAHLGAVGHPPIIYDWPVTCCEEVVTLQKAIESRGCPSRAPPTFITALSA